MILCFLNTTAPSGSIEIPRSIEIPSLSRKMKHINFSDACHNVWLSAIKCSTMWWNEQLLVFISHISSMMNHAANWCLCFQQIDSMIPLLLKYEISYLKPWNLWLLSHSLCWTWSENQKTCFVVHTYKIIPAYQFTKHLAD